MKEWFIYWIIPSLISFTLSLLMICHILTYTSIITHIFPLLYIIISLGDILQSISLLLHCQYRIIIFQLSILIKCISSLWSLILLYILICYNIKLKKSTFIKCTIIWYLYPIISSLILYYYNTDNIFCLYHNNNGYISNISNISNQIKILYFIFFFLPCIIAMIMIVILSLLNLRQLYLQGNLTNPHLIPLLRRLQWYPLIVTVCNIPSITMIAQLLITNSTTVLLMDISACTISLTGTFISLLYLHYTCHYTAPYSINHTLMTPAVSSKKSSYNSSVVSDYSNNQWAIGRHGGFFQWSSSASSNSHSAHHLSGPFHDTFRDSIRDILTDDDNDDSHGSTTPSTHLLDDYRRDYEEYYFPLNGEHDVNISTSIASGSERGNSTSRVPFHSNM